jgi:hypothetical protein
MIWDDLNARRGKGISDEDEEAYILGYRDALAAMVSDAVYYTVLGGKPGLYKHVQEVAKHLDGK